MLISEFLDDELLEGYLGRLAILNDHTGRLMLTQRLAKHVKKIKPHKQIPSDLVVQVAASHDCSVRQVLKHHTLWTLTSALNRQRNQARDKKICSRFVINLWPYLLPDKRYLRICPTCAQEDLEQRSFSYWRRSHQLPGRFFCPVHGNELRWATHPKALDVMPHDLLDEAQPFSSAVLIDAKNNEHVEKALLVCEHIIKTGDELRHTNYHPRLLEALRQQGICPDRTRDYNKFWQQLVKAFGPSWLEIVMDQVRPFGKQEGSFVRTVLSPRSYTALSTTAVVLTACRLFSTAEEVIQSICSPGLNNAA